MKVRCFPLGKNIRKYTVSELKIGAGAALLSVAVEALILAPKKQIPLPKGKKLTVQGLLPAFQKPIAGAARHFLNETVPHMMTLGDKLLQKIKIYQLLKEYFLDAVYLKADRYSLNDLFTRFFEKASFLDRNKFTAAFRDWAYSVLNSEEDRETFVNNLTDNIIAGLRALVSGPVASVLVSSHLLKVIEETVSNVVEKFMSTEFGNEMVNRLFDAIEHLEDMTLPYFLDTKMNLPRPVMEEKIDGLYNRYIGEGQVENYRSKNYGDQIYNMLASVDYDQIWKELLHHHLKELGQVSLGAAGTAIYLSGEMDKVSRRTKRLKERHQKLKSGIRSAKDKLPHRQKKEK